jgi:phage baseplate assembly protein W
MKSISIPFRFSTTGEVSFTTDPDTQVRQRITDVLMTTTGERIARSAYGGNIKAFLFELNDPLVFSDYKVDALSALNEHVTIAQIVDIRAVSRDLLAYGTPDESTLTILVQYRIPPYAVSTMNLTFDTNTFYTQESIL